MQRLKQENSSENERFIPRQEHNSLMTQWVPIGKTLWDILPPTEEGRHCSLFLARQWLPLSVPHFTTSCRLLQPSVPSSAMALLGSVEQCCPSPVQGSGSHRQWEALREQLLTQKYMSMANYPLLHFKRQLCVQI